MSVPDNRGIGVFWWEPAVTHGSGSYFDYDGNVLPVINVFDKFTRK
jgi:arabinogalactan endo-1,4-beta-galactosidase